MKKEFSVTSNGLQVYEYSIENEYIKASILNFGCIIQSLQTLDYENNFSNIVLGYDDIKFYEKNPPKFGCIVGRTAGRIHNSKFSVKDKEYNLYANDNNNSIHGGLKGFDQRLWDVEKYNETEIILSYISKDGEENYPGNVLTKVHYKLDGNKFIWSVEATTDETTPINITNHTYFNLSNFNEKASNHELKINADYFYTIDEATIPSENYSSVENTPFDFREFKTINKDIESENEQIKFGNGYDHSFVLDKKYDNAVEVYSPLTKKLMTIKTNQNICVFYTGNFLYKALGILSNKIKPENRLGVCFETQEVPNNIEKILITSEKKYYSYNEWIFSIKK